MLEKTLESPLDGDLIAKSPFPARYTQGPWSFELRILTKALLTAGSVFSRALQTFPVIFVRPSER